MPKTSAPDTYKLLLVPLLFDATGRAPPKTVEIIPEHTPSWAKDLDYQRRLDDLERRREFVRDSLE